MARVRRRRNARRGDRGDGTGGAGYGHGFGEGIPSEVARRLIDERGLRRPQS